MNVRLPFESAVGHALRGHRGASLAVVRYCRARPAAGHYLLSDAEWEAVRRYAKDEGDGTADAGDPYLDLATHYADTWNAYAEIGLEPTEDGLSKADDELAGSDWVVDWDEEAGAWVVRHADQLQRLHRYAAERAPKGGVSIGGKMYRGGQWIPASQVAAADEVTKAKIKEHSEGIKAKRAGRGAVDTVALRKKLSPHAGTELSESDVSSAKRTFAGLLDHHGPLVVHRLEEIANDLHDALSNPPVDEDGAGGQFTRRLASVNAMLDMAHAKGHTGEVGKGKAEAAEKAAEPEQPKSEPAPEPPIEPVPAAGDSAKPDDEAPAEPTAKVEQPARGGAMKKPWQMTAFEFGRQRSGNPHFDQDYPANQTESVYYRDVGNAHRREVESALASGEKVPPKVLADYPDLKPKGAEQEAAPTPAPTPPPASPAPSRPPEAGPEEAPKPGPAKQPASTPPTSNPLASLAPRLGSDPSVTYDNIKSAVAEMGKMKGADLHKAVQDAGVAGVYGKTKREYLQALENTLKGRHATLHRTGLRGQEKQAGVLPTP